MFDENSNTAAGAGAVVAQSGALAPGTIPGNVSAPNSAIVTQLLNVKDSRWLQVETDVPVSELHKHTLTRPSALYCYRTPFIPWSAFC
ncbi:unnamed protein product [Cylicostephanus goldi]|uniref:Uncharacterized protein n=1 Tax=Cylicostephanus goldi TaxID=71465 RepID=A0A3P6RBM4_CYLGO|nr:unnamed protein product [Cylicostephanus goldi]